ncbi:MAG: VOC family protein [Myxococcales bacterium]|nr:VOC family protein [Myxococcales bacterium]
MLAKIRIGNLVYYVADIARAEAFYRDVLGLEVLRMGDDGSGNEWLMAKTAGGLDLLFFRNSNAKAGQSPVIVYDLVDGGIDGIVEGLAQKGATIVTPISQAPGGWSADLADPDGHTFSFYQTNEKPR